MTRQASPVVLLTLLSVVVFLVMVVLLMLGPLLVDLAREFNTSIAVTGQLGAATAITWGIAAPLVGPVSDSYGKRPILLAGLLLMALGILGSVIAWNYISLLGFRLLTGLGAGMVPPNCIAIVADIFPPEGRGKAIGWIVTATGIGAAFGVAAVAFLLDLGGWRLPFIVIGVTSLVLWLISWVWLPQSHRQSGWSFSFISHYRETGSNATIWYMLAAHSLLNMCFIAVFSYLAARLIQTYGLTAGETVLPLGLAGLGLIIGGFIGGWVSGHRHRLAMLTGAALASALLGVLVFSGPAATWPTVALAFGVGSMNRVSTTLTPTLLLELAGSSRATATGLFAVSNQVSVFGGASIGGAMLALGGFSAVGYFSAGVAIAAAVVVTLKVRNPAEFLQRVAARESSIA